MGASWGEVTCGGMFTESIFEKSVWICRKVLACRFRLLLKQPRHRPVAIIDKDESEKEKCYDCKDFHSWHTGLLVSLMVNKLFLLKNIAELNLSIKWIGKAGHCPKMKTRLRFLDNHEFRKLGPSHDSFQVSSDLEIYTSQSHLVRSRLSQCVT
jgi:hypothetical protein